MVTHASNSSSWEVEAGGSEFKVILKAMSGPARVPETLSKKEKEEEKGGGEMERKEMEGGRKGRKDRRVQAED